MDLGITSGPPEPIWNLVLRQPSGTFPADLGILRD